MDKSKLENITDLHFARMALLEFNQLVSNDPLLSSVFIIGKYDYLQLYQPLIFLDLRNYYKKKIAEKPDENRVEGKNRAGDGRRDGKSPKHPPISTFLFGFLVLLYSTISILILWILRPPILIFSSDKTSSRFAGDFRIAGIYDFLSRKNVRFFEFFHTTLTSRWFRNILNRRRPAFYLEALDALYYLKRFFYGKTAGKFTSGLVGQGDIFELETHARATETIDIKIVCSLISKYARNIPKTDFRISALSKMISLSGSKALFTIDSVRRYGEIVAAADKAGLPVFAFQHGQFTKYQVGWISSNSTGQISGKIIKPKKLFLWSEYWKKQLEELNTYFTDDELEIGGNPKGDNFSGEEKKAIPSRNISDQKNNLNILMLYETDTPKEEIKRYLEKIKDSNMSLFFKIRPDMSADFQLGQYGLAGADRNVRIVTGIDFREIDAVVGTQSSFLYEAVEAMKPVFIIKTKMDYADQMVDSGLAERIESPDEFLNKIEGARNISRETLEKRKEILMGKTPVSIYETLENLSRELGL